MYFWLVNFLFGTGSTMFIMHEHVLFHTLPVVQPFECCISSPEATVSCMAMGQEQGSADQNCWGVPWVLKSWKFSKILCKSRLSLGCMKLLLSVKCLCAILEQSGQILLSDSCGSHSLVYRRGTEYIATGSVMLASWASMTLSVITSLTV